MNRYEVSIGAIRRTYDAATAEDAFEMFSLDLDDIECPDDDAPIRVTLLDRTKDGAQ